MEGMDLLGPEEIERIERENAGGLSASAILEIFRPRGVRRINAIKKMMAEGHTLEDIKRSFLFHKNHIDQLERDLSVVLNGFQSELGGRPFGGEYRQALEEQLENLRRRAQDLVRDVARLGSAVTAHGDETPGSL
jgi:hypothetical protein